MKGEKGDRGLPGLPGQKGDRVSILFLLSRHQSHVDVFFSLSRDDPVNQACQVCFKHSFLIESFKFIIIIVYLGHPGLPGLPGPQVSDLKNNI